MGVWLSVCLKLDILLEKLQAHLVAPNYQLSNPTYNLPGYIKHTDTKRERERVCVCVCVCVLKYKPHWNVPVPPLSSDHK